MIKEIHPMDPLLQKLLPPQKPLPGVVYRPSQFAIQTGAYIWNALTQRCIEAQLPEAVRAGEGFDELIAAYDLVPDDKDECRFYEGISSLARALTRKPGHRSYTILPTLGCNARCVYCYEQGMVQVRMTAETVEAAAHFILSTCARQRIRINWFGGEPLLCPEIIDRISSALTEAGQEFHAGMISNGSLITPDILKRMTGPWKLDEIQLSMDCAEEDYIRRKRYYSYQDVYHHVLEQASQMSQAGIRVLIRCNVDRGNLDQISAFLTDAERRIPCRENVGICFSPLNAERLGQDDLRIWSAIMEARPLIRQAGFRPPDSLCGNGQFRVYHCMADAESPVICPDGSLYLCDHCPPEAQCGDIRNGIAGAASRTVFGRTDRTRDKCRQCPYLPVCTSFSGCPVEDTHCREIRDMDLPYLISQFFATDSQGSHTTIC